MEEASLLETSVVCRIVLWVLRCLDVGRLFIIAVVEVEVGTLLVSYVAVLDFCYWK